ncbi:MAG: hypothetical protein LUF68_09760 [Clostridiales bacterium]|nr:hypothetical protein [Clostridiales bacterium]
MSDSSLHMSMLLQFSVIPRRGAAKLHINLLFRYYSTGKTRLQPFLERKSGRESVKQRTPAQPEE